MLLAVQSEAGKQLEQQVVDVIDSVGGSLIGPNCVGIVTPQHSSIFTQPIPKLDRPDVRQHVFLEKPFLPDQIEATTRDLAARDAA